MKGFRKPFLSALALLCLSSFPVLADCANPAGVESQIVYNADYKVLQFCNGTDWISMAGGVTTCSNAPAVPGDGYFVLASGAWNGNLGGRAGANAKCLSDLTANDWMGKTDANSRGLLVASHVRAFLCDSVGCEMANPNTRYFFAISNDNTKGGAYFDADASGQGPNNLYSWIASNYFGTGAKYWTGRRDEWGDNSFFVNNANPHCTDWSSSSTGEIGGIGDPSMTNSGRWNYGSVACNTALTLICFVNP